MMLLTLITTNIQLSLTKLVNPIYQGLSQQKELLNHHHQHIIPMKHSRNLSYLKHYTLLKSTKEHHILKSQPRKTNPQVLVITN